jgi:hypothetical protein
LLLMYNKDVVPVTAECVLFVAYVQ